MSLDAINTLDYSQWVSYRWCSKRGVNVPDFQEGQRNPYHPAYVWDYSECIWVHDHNYVGELSGAGYGMTAGYELAPGTSAVMYVLYPSGEGNFTFLDSSNARIPAGSNETPSITTTFIPTTDTNVIEGDVYVPNMTYKGSRTPITVRVYGENNQIIGTATGYGDTMTVSLDWGSEGTGEETPLWFSGYKEYHELSYVPPERYSWPWYQKTFQFIDDDGAVHIILIDQEFYEVNHFTNASGSWVAARADSGSYSIKNAGDAKMDLSDNSFHIAFIDFTSSTIAGIGYITNKTGSWVETLILTPAENYPVLDAVIAVDDSGKPHIMYVQKNGSTYDLYYINNLAGSWSTPELVANVAAITYSDMSLEVAGSVGQSAVFAYDSGAASSAILRTSGIWGSPFLITSSGGTAINVLKTDTHFHIYFNDPTIGTGIKQRKYLIPTMASDGISSDILSLGNNYPLTNNTRYRHAAQIDAGGRIVLSLQYQNGISETGYIAYSDDDGDTWTVLTYTGITNPSYDFWSPIFTSNSANDRGLFYGIVHDINVDALYLLGYSVSTKLSLDHIEIDYEGDGEDIIDGFFANDTQQTQPSSMTSNSKILYLDTDGDGAPDIIAVFNPPLTDTTTVTIVIVGGEVDDSSSLPPGTVVGVGPGVGDGTITIIYDKNTGRWREPYSDDFTVSIIYNTGIGSGHTTISDKFYLVPWLIVD